MSGRVVVLGGGGFLGSHLCDHLVERGDEVVCVDDFSTGRRSNVAHLDGHPRFTLVEADISGVAPGGRPGDRCLQPGQPGVARPTIWPFRSRPWPWGARGPGGASSWPIATGPGS